MNKNIVLITFIFAFFPMSCSAKNENNVVVKSKKISSGIDFSANFENGIAVHKISYTKESLSGKWLLQFKKNSGTEVSNKKGEQATSSISIVDYKILLSAILEEINRAQKVNIDHLQIDVDFVEEVQEQVVGAIQSMAANNHGLIQHKDQKSRGAMIAVLTKSELVKFTCQEIKKYSMQCSADRIDSNPIAFQRSYLGQDWEKIMKVKDTGLSSSTWFNISLERLKTN